MTGHLHGEKELYQDSHLGSHKGNDKAKHKYRYHPMHISVLNQKFDQYYLLLSMPVHVQRRKRQLPPPNQLNHHIYAPKCKHGYHIPTPLQMLYCPLPEIRVSSSHGLRVLRLLEAVLLALRSRFRFSGLSSSCGAWTSFTGSPFPASHAAFSAC